MSDTNTNTNTKAVVKKKGTWSHTVNDTVMECLKTGDSVFTAPGGDTFTIHALDFVSKEIWTKLSDIPKMFFFNGIAQKVVDKTAGQPTVERIRLMADTYNNLMAGQWNAGRTGMTEEQKQLNGAVRSLIDLEKAGELTAEQKTALEIVRQITSKK